MVEENMPRAQWHRGEEEEETLQLSEIWSMFWEHKIWYALSVFLCLVVAVFYIYRTPKSYNCQAKVIIDEDAENSAMRDLTSFAGGLSQLKGKGGINVYNEIEAFTSPDLMSSVIKRLHYESSYHEVQFMRKKELFLDSPVSMSLGGDNPSTFFSFRMKKTSDSTFVLNEFVLEKEKIECEDISGVLGEPVKTPVGTVSINPTAQIDKWERDIDITWNDPMSLAKLYLLHLTASLSDKQSSVVVLTLTGNFPAKSKIILGTLIDIYNENWVDNKNKSAVYTTKFINERLRVIEKELGNVEESIKDYKEKNKITDIQAVSGIFLQESSEYGSKGFEVNNQLTIATYIREFLSDPRHADDLIPANSGITSTSVESQIKDYNECLLNRNRLRAESSDDNPAVAQLTDALAQLKMAVNRSIESLIATLQLQVNKFASQEEEINRKIASTSGQQLHLVSVERQQKIKEQLYVYLLQKREENEISAQVNVGNTRLIVEPNNDRIPVAPKGKIILLLAIIAGCAIPFGIIFMYRQLDTTLKGRNDIALLTAPFLAEIPQINRKRGLLARLDRRSRFDDKEICRILVEQGSRDSVNEAFRVLRTNIDLMASGTEGCHKVMVTSFNPNAGKTFMIMNMAASMALKGSKTLLLDLDFRKATLSKALEKNSTGVASYLNGKTTDIRERIISLRPNLSLLPVGSLPPNPAELLVSERFKTMIDTLTREYDYIFIDCPPVDVVADTGIIAKFADMSVFVMRAGLFDRRALPAVEELYNSGRYNRMAIILNGVEYEKAGGYGYGHYGYGYGHYGYGNDEKTEGDES